MTKIKPVVFLLHSLYAYSFHSLKFTDLIVCYYFEIYMNLLSGVRTFILTVVILLYYVKETYLYYFNQYKRLKHNHIPAPCYKSSELFIYLPFTHRISG